MAHPRIHTVTASTPDGTTVTIETANTAHGRVIITAGGSEVMVGTTFVHEGKPFFWPGPSGGMYLSPDTLHLIADLTEQAHQEH